MTNKMLADRVRLGRWRRILPGVYVVGQSHLTEKAQAMGAVLWAGTGAVLSGPSAGRLFGLIHCSTTPLHVTIPRKVNSAHGIRVRHDPRLDRSQIAIFDGIPVTRVGRTIFDLCGHMNSTLAAEVVMDAIRQKLIDLPRLVGVLDDIGGQGVRGTKQLRRILGERFAYDVTDSGAEDLFIRMARRRGLRFTFHHVVRDGSFVAELDFSHPHLRLGIEIDGRRDHDDPVAAQRDKNRDVELARRGWLVLRFTYWDLVQRPDWVFDSIATAIALRSPAQPSIESYLSGN